MFLLSPVSGRLAGKHGPRWFMTFGPLIAAAGFLLMLRMRAHAAYFTEMLPGMLVFGVGLACTVSPLTAAILGDIDQRHAGIGSAINNAIARVAGPARDRGHRRDPGGAVRRRPRRRAARAPRTPRARAFLPRPRDRPLDTAVPKDARLDAPMVKAMLDDASVEALHGGLWAMAGALAVGGLISAAGIRNPKRQ